MNLPPESQQPHQPQPPLSAYQRPPKPPPAPWQRRQRWGSAGIAAGVMAVVAALLIDFKWYSAGSVSHLNGLCSSGLGQLVQAASGRAASGCSTAALLDHLVGWGIIAGLLAIAAGVAARVSGRHLRAAGAPAGPGTGGPVPFPPSPGGELPGPPSGTYPFPPSPQG